MTVSIPTMRRMVEAGLKGEALPEILALIAEDYAPKARSKNADRQARWRARRNRGDVTDNVTRNVTVFDLRLSRNFFCLSALSFLILLSVSSLLSIGGSVP